MKRRAKTNPFKSKIATWPSAAGQKWGGGQLLKNAIYMRVAANNELYPKLY